MALWPDGDQGGEFTRRRSSIKVFCEDFETANSNRDVLAKATSPKTDPRHDRGAAGSRNAGEANRRLSPKRTTGFQKPRCHPRSARRGQEPCQAAARPPQCLTSLASTTQSRGHARPRPYPRARPSSAASSSAFHLSAASSAALPSLSKTSAAALLAGSTIGCRNSAGGKRSAIR